MLSQALKLKHWQITVQQASPQLFSRALPSSAQTILSLMSWLCERDTN